MLDQEILDSFLAAHKERRVTEFTRLVFVGGGRIVAIPDRPNYWGEHGNHVRGLIIDTQGNQILPAFVRVNYVGQIEEIWTREGMEELGEVDCRSDRVRHSFTVREVGEVEKLLRYLDGKGTFGFHRLQQKDVSFMERPEWQGFILLSIPKN